MDIFKFHNPSIPTLMQYGEIINGLTSKTWIERYVGAGEFTIKGLVNSNLRNILPLGTYLSHPDTREIMVVENHEIAGDETSQSEPEIIITGRSLEAQILENRALYFPGGLTQDPNYTWIQAQQVIDMLINPDPLFWWIDPALTIPYIKTATFVGGTGPSEPKKLITGELYKYILDLIKPDNVGIRINRPTDTDPNTYLVLYRGFDLSQSVTFTYDTGEIVNAEYLWSNKKYKNVAIVESKWTNNVVDLAGGATGIGRRVMYVDATHLDSNLDAPPGSPPGTGPDWDVLNSNAIRLGYSALANQANIALTKAQVAKEGANFRYRKHFNLGDLVSVHGNYDERRVMRVTEYVETEDDSGAFSYPTLSVDPTS